MSVARMLLRNVICSGKSVEENVCAACVRHLFRTEAFRCHGKCKGEFHAECSVRHDWTCGKCKQDNSISKEDFGKLKSAVDDISKNLAETDAKITTFRVGTEAGKISNNVGISELKTQMQSMHIRFDMMEKKTEALKTVMNTTMTELKTAIGRLESKIVLLTTRQTKFDQIDISGIQDTLNNASHVIITEMCRTLDRLLEERIHLLTVDPTEPEQQKTSKIDPKVSLLEEKMQMFKIHDHSQFKKQQQQRQQQRSQGEESLRKLPSPQHPNTTRLQQLTAQFQS